MADRLRVLAAHLGAASAAPAVVPAPAAARSLPPVDAATLEAVLDPDAAKRSMKRDVYAMFAARPDLLVPHVEGLTKGEREQGAVSYALRRPRGAGRGSRPLPAAPTDGWPVVPLSRSD